MHPSNQPQMNEMQTKYKEVLVKFNFAHSDEVDEYEILSNVLSTIPKSNYSKEKIAETLADFILFYILGTTEHNKKQELIDELKTIV